MLNSISGRLVYSPEIRFMPTGVPVLSFELACAGRNIHCEAQGDMAEQFGEEDHYPEPHTRVVVRGTPVVRKWHDYEGKQHMRTILRLTQFAYRDDHGNTHRFGEQ